MSVDRRVSVMHWGSWPSVDRSVGLVLLEAEVASAGLGERVLIESSQIVYSFLNVLDIVKLWLDNLKVHLESQHFNKNKIKSKKAIKSQIKGQAKTVELSAISTSPLLKGS